MANVNVEILFILTNIILHEEKVLRFFLIFVGRIGPLAGNIENSNT